MYTITAACMSLTGHIRQIYVYTVNNLVTSCDRVECMQAKTNKLDPCK